LLNGCGQKKRFYVIESLRVGHWVDAVDKQDAIDAVMWKDKFDFDVLENNRIIKVQLVDDAFPFGEGKE